MNGIRGTSIIIAGLLFFFSLGCAPAEISQSSATALTTITSTNLPTSTVIYTPEPTIILLPTQTPSPATITFELEGGGTYEMLKFDTAQEALTFIAQHARWYKGEPEAEGMPAHTEWLKITPETTVFFEPIHRIPGLQPKLGLALPPTGEQFFVLNIEELENGTVLLFESVGAKFVLLYVAMEEKAFEESLGNYDVDKLCECMQTGGTTESCQKSPINIFTPTAQP